MSNNPTAEAPVPASFPYVDLQVNGYAGVDFNDPKVTPDQFHAACRHLQSDGVTQILATIITDTPEHMARCLANIAQFREADPLAQQIIAGIHIEGPFISPEDGYRGAHPLDAVTPANLDLMNRLLDAAAGLTRLVTLAPESDPHNLLTKHLTHQSITVAAGHTNATVDQLRSAIDAGLTMFTHLGNGCPMFPHRHDNIIQRVLYLADQLFISFIADGVHVPFTALANYLKFASLDHCLIVTDAIAPAGLGPGQYTLARWNLNIGPDMVARAPDGSHLVGAAITMNQSAQNLAQHLNLTADQLTQLLVDNPRRAINL